MPDSRLIPAAVVGGLLALGLAAAGLFVAMGLKDVRTGDRSVTVRGLSERIVKADLAVLPLKFAAAGDDLQAVQADVDRSTGAVLALLLASSTCVAEFLFLPASTPSCPGAGGGGHASNRTQKDRKKGRLHTHTPVLTARRHGVQPNKTAQADSLARE